MIESSFEETVSKEWVKIQINDLVILRQIIPWQTIINQLTQFYKSNCGRIGKSLRVMVALIILSQQKLAGEQHIDNRIVSLDEIDARPIKKGKSYPSCEFGTTLQMSFNRQGFMITTENFIGNPSDKTFYTLNLFVQRMHGYPDIAVTDLGFRSRT